MTTRRQFVQMSAAAGAAMAFGGVPAAAASGRARAPRRGAAKRILILGGTGFLGPATVEAALARGHSVTIFNRGRTEKRKPLEIDNIERLYGNRDPNLPADDSKDAEGNPADPDSPRGLAQLGGKKWDVVIDNSGYYPRMVKASAELLAPNVGRYIFISSISAYARNDQPGSDETAAAATLADPAVETMGEQFQNYGGLKALCEQAAEAAMPGRVANVRPGYIVGPGDPTDRFTYWPVRVNEGGEVLAPGTPVDPVQIIDVRDLAEWLVKLAEDGTTGLFNACGPAEKLEWGRTLEACVAAASKPATLTWVDSAFLDEQFQPGEGLPIWIAPSGEFAGFHQWSNARAVAAGLAFRPVEVTVKDTLAWWPNEVARRTRVTAEIMAEADAKGQPRPPMADPSRPRAGLKPEREAEILKAWHERYG
jgi:2'-hydroxyisoflavone reductase